MTRMVGTKLYRREAMEAGGAKWFGNIRIVQPLAVRVCAIGGVALAVLAILFLCVAEHDRKASLAGVILPGDGIVNIASEQNAIVEAVLADEGQLVDAGRAVIRLRADRSTDEGRSAAFQKEAMRRRKAAIESDFQALTSQLLAKQQSLRRQHASLRAEIAEFSDDIGNGRERIRLARQTVDKFRVLLAQGFVSEVQLQQRVEESMDLELRERAFRRQLEASKRIIDEVIQEIQACEHQQESAKAKRDGELAALDQEEKDLDGRTQWVLDAPRRGQVASVNVSPGQHVTAGLALVTLLPGEQSSRSLRAILFASSQAIGLISPGQKVVLRIGAFPYQKFGFKEGEIESIGIAPINPQDMPVGQGEAIFSGQSPKEPLYRIYVKLDSQFVESNGLHLPLRSGMGVVGSIKLDRRTLVEWLFEPILGLKKM